MSQPHERLSEAMRKRGLQLGKRWVHIARDADITTSALGAIRRGEYRPSPHTATALDEALEWAPGSVERILAGGEPTVAGQVRLEARGYRSDIPTDEELRRSGLKPETAEAIIRMRERIARAAAEGDETLIRRMDRVTEALDEDRDAG